MSWLLLANQYSCYSRLATNQGSIYNPEAPLTCDYYLIYQVETDLASSAE